MSDDSVRDIERANEALRAQTEIKRWFAESDKFVAEQRKLMAEAAKFERERWTSVVLAVGAALGALTGFALVVGKLLGWTT
jgi:ElaB/YqjD/DUF883 family membrane-anchored ribosome-binding protein